MKIPKILFCILIILSVFLIYKIAFKKKVNYVALGDSLAMGVNSYGEVDYGYTDYIKDYLLQNDKLGDYNKVFVKRDYKIENLYDDIFNNKVIVFDGKRYNIKSILREAKLVTISIGMNNFKDEFTIDNIEKNIKENDTIKERLNNISNEFDSLLTLIKKYSKGNIIVIGFYNPFPCLDSYKAKIDTIVKYMNNKYYYICKKQNVQFVDIFSIFDNEYELLPNPFNVNPNIEGYKRIFNKIKPILDNILK